ncbi:MAG: FAD-dependent oxidoreductase, partial [Verrucomicrobiota bacterium]
ENVQKYLEDLLYKHILPKSKNIKIDRWWSGILGVGKQKTPIVKCLSDNLAVAVRMGGMGVAIGTLMGKKGGEMLWG